MTKYVCYGDDGEDLTEAVKQAIEESDTDAIFAYDDDGAPHRVVRVKCVAKGHVNEFEV